MKSLFLKVILPLFGIAAILGFITIVNPVQQSKAAWSVNSAQEYISTCGGVGGGVWIAPVGGNSCDSSFDAGMEVYTQNNSGSSKYTIYAQWQTFWCDTAVATCADNPQDGDIQPVAATTTHVTVSALHRTSMNQFAGLACGHYQDDFGFYVVNNQTGNVVCNYNIYQAIHHINGHNLAQDGHNNNAAYCVAQQEVCTVPTPTPTNTPTPTVTPTSTPTPTVTPTSTPTPTPTHAPKPTPTTTTGCGGTQVGFNNNSNCQNQNQNQSQDQLQLQDQSQFQINGNNDLDNSSNNSSTNNNSNSNNINIQLDVLPLI